MCGRTASKKVGSCSSSGISSSSVELSSSAYGSWSCSVSSGRRKESSRLTASESAGASEAGAEPEAAAWYFAANSARSLSASTLAAAAAAASSVQSRCVGRRARPLKASTLSGCVRNSTISHSSLPSWLRYDSSSAGVANPPLPLVMTLYSQRAINYASLRVTAKASQKAGRLPRLFWQVFAGRETQLRAPARGGFSPRRGPG
ncbi:MAG: hypothetical protein BWX86_01554 [Verrucomicrobia bacterium ADurb.Bin122]|nr:MAG: hypothetical protein BWX86_01554 [Verrucomicrobia bacterium ADurb.Bin122]